MNPEILGQRIKEARLAKKMTQSEVVGSFITRNMLSQIESGTATPSMKTLSYLAQVLDIPLSALLAGTDPEASADGFSYASDSTSASAGIMREASRYAAAVPELSPLGELQQLRTLYADKHYSELLDFISDISESDFLYSEKAAYRARASYAQALTAEQTGELSQALTYAQEAEKWADIGFYSNPSLKADALLLLSRLAAELSKKYHR